ncbi:Hypothetical predicted protein [Cloeon dipterum]|uniref:PSI domain-containing protein n=1 Tax=Cloeon dipterum TaxID=197152 RepID=A0A8S1DKC9_9INSE|nr:Hypothetical predicted protein [Cloeon dipterum]
MARLYDRLSFIFLTAIVFLVYGIASAETDDVIKRQRRVSVQATDKHYSMNFKYVNNDNAAVGKSSEILLSDEKATKLSDDQFSNGIAFIDLPFAFPFFDLNVTRVAVRKEGIILSADPSANWTIAPLNAKSGMSCSSIYHLVRDNTLYVQWIDFRFNHKDFEEHKFRFQVRLSDTGKIEFVYQEVPYIMKALQKRCDCLEDKFGVMYTHQELFKVAPYNETYELGFSLDFEEYRVNSGTLLTFYTADGCMFRKNCSDCTRTEYHLTSNLTARCLWCPAIEKCSSTRDSLRNVWMENKCDVNATSFCSYDFEGDSSSYYSLLFFATVLIIVIIVIIFLLYKYGGELLSCKTSSGYSFVKDNDQADDVIQMQEIPYMSDDEFIDGKAFIDVPFGLQLFDLNVTRVAVTKEGTILSADPSVNWTIAPLNAKSGKSKCQIFYLMHRNILYVQWINFQFIHEDFQEHKFKFLVKLSKKGEIKFLYQEVPYNLQVLRSYCIFVEDKFGIMYSRQEEFKVAPYKKTYELGFPLDFEEYSVKRGTALRFYTADRCLLRKNCHACTETMSRIDWNETVQCSWCPAIEKCSTTTDAFQQVWMENKCNDFHLNETKYCSITLEEDSTSNSYLTALIIVIVAIAFIVILKILCCGKRSKNTADNSELIAPLNQPNNSNDNNAAGTQDNFQEVVIVDSNV